MCIPYLPDLVTLKINFAETVFQAKSFVYRDKKIYLQGSVTLLNTKLQTRIKEGINNLAPLAFAKCWYPIRY